jgi:hypothetical protein
MSKHRISHEGNPFSSAIDSANVYPPSPEEKHKRSLEINPNNISTIQFFLDEQVMEDFLGANYIMNETRETIGVKHCSE